MINHSSFARLILATKSNRIEDARAMGQRNRAPWDPERSPKMRETLSILNAMSAEARRYYRAERRSRWLTNCIVERGEIKTFDLAGRDPPTGRRYDIHIEMSLDAPRRQVGIIYERRSSLAAGGLADPGNSEG
jgi:hypothetical protein